MLALQLATTARWIAVCVVAALALLAVAGDGTLEFLLAFRQA